MLKRDITFEDYDGKPVTETFYFNLNKAELLEMELSSGGMQDKIKEIVAANDVKSIMAVFKEILLASVGRKSEDGRRFIKNDEIRDDFQQSNAYPTMFVELATNDKSASEFINGLLPADLVQQVQASKDETASKDLVKKFEDYARQELLEMSDEDFYRIVPRDPKDMSREQLLLATQRKTS